MGRNEGRLDTHLGLPSEVEQIFPTAKAGTGKRGGWLRNRIARRCVGKLSNCLPWRQTVQRAWPAWLGGAWGATEAGCSVRVRGGILQPGRASPRHTQLCAVRSPARCSRMPPGGAAGSQRDHHAERPAEPRASR